MRKKIYLSYRERISLIISIDSHIDRLSNTMSDLNLDIHYDKVMFDAYNEMRHSLYMLRLKIENATYGKELPF